jgi:hypothetical protein
MKHARILLTIGLWMAFIPFTGIPFRWHQILFLITGILVVIWAFRIYITLKKTGNTAIKKTTNTQAVLETEEDIEDDQAIPESLQPKLELITPGQLKKEDAPSSKELFLTKEKDERKEKITPPVTEKQKALLLEKDTEIKKEKNTTDTKETQKALKPNRKLLTLSAMMLGRQFQKTLEIERVTPRIRITKPQVRFKDIPILAEEEDDKKEDELIETISIENEEIEVITDEEIDAPIESFDIDTEASFTKNAAPPEDKAEEPEEIETIEDEDFLTNTQDESSPEKESEEPASELFSQDQNMSLNSSLLSRLSDDFDDEEDEED